MSVRVILSGILIIFGLSSVGWAANYYVDFDNGNDANDGLSQQTARKNIPGTMNQGSTGRISNNSGWVKLGSGDILGIKSGTIHDSSDGGRILIDSSYYTSGISVAPITIQRDPNWGSGQIIIDGTLLEGNREYICTDTTSNCHFVIMRNQGATCDTIIIRYNSNHETQSDMELGGVADTVLNTRVYNNTFGYQTVPDNWGIVWGTGSDGGKIVNNIFYNNVTPGYYVHYDKTRVVLGSNNLVFNTGYSGSWNALYSSESTYGALRNSDPLFVNYPLDISLQSASPAIDAGGPLTTVAADDSAGGTTLIVGEAKFFQPGWAGTNADWIAVGTVSNVVQISAVNYANNTITLANAIPRSPGDSVWLYKKSDGVRVLYGTAPDIGVYEYTGTTAIVPSAPRNLKIR